MVRAEQGLLRAAVVVAWIALRPGAQSPGPLPPVGRPLFLLKRCCFGAARWCDCYCVRKYCFPMRSNVSSASLLPCWSGSIARVRFRQPSCDQPLAAIGADGCSSEAGLSGAGTALCANAHPLRIGQMGTHKHTRPQPQRHLRQVRPSGRQRFDELARAATMDKRQAGAGPAWSARRGARRDDQVAQQDERQTLSPPRRHGALARPGRWDASSGRLVCPSVAGRV